MNIPVKFSLSFCLSFLLLASVYFIGVNSRAEAKSDVAQNAWETIAPGVEFQKFHLTQPRPIDIFVTRMDRANPEVTIDSAIAQGRLSGGTETVSGMFARYQQAINYWGKTWGNRNRVVVAINGYFFGPEREPPGVPWSGLVQSGWYAKRFYETVGDAGFTWKLDGTAHIGKCVYHRGEKNDVTFVDAGYDPNIQAVNVARTNEELILYTSHFDGTTKTSAPRVEISIEVDRPALLISDPNYVLGYVRDIRKNQGSTPIPFDHVVLSAWGDIGDALVSRINSGAIKIGSEVRLTQEITDCLSEPKHDWANVYASMGGDYHFLNGGDLTIPNNQDATWPNSRTAIAYNENYVFFVVVDAFNPRVSEGITIPELANFLTGTLGATDAVTLDSGTSSTMVVNGAVVNNTYCNYTRKCGSQASSSETPFSQMPESSSEQTIEWSTAEVQAYVGSAMLMVVVEPLARSSTFTSTQVVTTAAETSLRLGPGSNYASTGTVPAGVTGVVQEPINGLNGVLAKGSYWWKVDFGGSVGWVREEALQGGSLPSNNLPYSVFLPSVRR
jgi:hypothetical protein